MYESPRFFFRVFRRSRVLRRISPSSPATATGAPRCFGSAWAEVRGEYRNDEKPRGVPARASIGVPALRIRYFFGLLFSRRNPRIRCIDNGIRLLLCHPLPRNNTLPSYNSLPADQYFCPCAAHGIGTLPLQFAPLPLAPVLSDPLHLRLLIRPAVDAPANVSRGH